MSDRLAVMAEGRVEQVGAPADVYSEPSSAYVADFLGSANVLDVEVLPSLSFRLCDQVLTAGSGHCHPGKGRLVARPERLALEPRLNGSQLSAPAGQFLPGTVERRGFLGATGHVVVRLPNDTTLTVGTAAHDPSSFPPGTPVTVALPSEALRLLP